MKKPGKTALFSIALAALLGFSACSPQTAGLTREAYGRAQENCAAFIGEHFSQSYIDTGRKSAAPLLEEEKHAVFVVVDGPADYFAETAGQHWVFTIGDTSGHQYAKIVCSETGQVIGYIPIE